MNLNQEQQQAVDHKDGPLLVLAGPGSGKTAVIARRTKKLITEYHTAPSSILVVTFTKAAARQMRERFLHLMGEQHTEVTFGTFHGVFYGILRHAYGITGKNIAGEEQTSQLLSEIIRKTSMDMEDEKELKESLVREISLVKQDRIPLTHYYSASCPDKVFRQIFTEYERQLHGARLLDFDDIMVYCYKLFQMHPEILYGWQKKFRYILIDEFQDVNRIQYDIIRLLALPENNLFLVGDDDQSIYRFRGAKPEIMLQIPKDYPNIKQVILKKNYRCTGEVVEKSQNLIRWNDVRFDKELCTDNPKGKPLEIRSFENESEETIWLAQKIRKNIQEGTPLREIAILFRTNSGCRMTVERMMEYNLPFIMRDVLPNLYEHWLAKHMKAYMRLAMGGRNRRDFLSIMNKPNRYLSREAFYEPEISFETLYQFYEGKEWMCDRIEELEHHLKTMARMTPFAAISYIRSCVGYDSYLKEYAEYRKIKVEELYDLLREIQESAREYDTFQEWFASMERYKEMLREQAEKIRNRQEGITISTLHSVKGLEYQQVYIMDVNEGSIPYHKAVADRDMEEERRMFYVGMTRAKKELHLYSVKEKFGKKQEPSRFLLELEEAPKRNGRKKKDGEHKKRK